MLKIHGQIITDPYADSLNREFGLSFERDELLDDSIIWYIESTKRFNFPNMRMFAREVLKCTTSTRALRIKFVHPRYQGPYRIRMTGCRAKDFKEANRKAGLGKTPDSYTWHHAEGITKVGRKDYECEMYLIRSDYHRRNRHRGGVHEYERRTRKTYQ